MYHRSQLEEVDNADDSSLDLEKDTFNSGINDDVTDDNDVGGDMVMASYLLSLETGICVSKKAIDVVKDNTNYLLDFHLNQHKLHFKNLLLEQGVDPSLVETLQ